MKSYPYQGPIADVIVAYDCKRSNQTYLLVARNVLYIDDMEDNLIPPFIMRQAGLTVSEIAKIHCDPDELTDDDCTIRSCQRPIHPTTPKKHILLFCNEEAE